MTTQVFKLSLQGKTYDSGVLLAGGQYILTVAHLFNTDANPSDLTINANAHATAIYIHPSWRNDPSNAESLMSDPISPNDESTTLFTSVASERKI